MLINYFEYWAHVSMSSSFPGGVWDNDDDDNECYEDNHNDPAGNAHKIFTVNFSSCRFQTCGEWEPVKTASTPSGSVPSASSCSGVKGKGFVPCCTLDIPLFALPGTIRWVRVDYPEIASLKRRLLKPFEGSRRVCRLSLVTNRTPK